MSFLLDTNVISEARKPSGDDGVKTWLAATPGPDLYLSVLVIGEVRRGIARLRPRDSAQAAIYEAWLRLLHQAYADRLLPITVEIAETWGTLNAAAPLPTIDGLLAATALVHGLTLVTRNTADVARTGVRLLNPFSRPG